MLHKSTSKLCRKVHRPLRTFTDWRIIKICPYLSVSVRICPYAKHNGCFFLLILSKALFPIWVDITDRVLFLLFKYLAFLEKGWGLGKGKTSFLVKRSFSLPQEPSTLIGNSAYLKKNKIPAAQRGKAQGGIRKKADDQSTLMR